MVALLPRRRQRVEARRDRFRRSIIKVAIRHAIAKAATPADVEALWAIYDDDDAIEQVLVQAESDANVDALLDDAYERPPRDWKGFFEALTNFLLAVLPLILQMFGGLGAAEVSTVRHSISDGVSSSSHQVADYESSAIGDRLRQAKGMANALRRVQASFNMGDLRRLLDLSIERVKSDGFLEILQGSRLIAHGAGWESVVEVFDLLIGAVAGPRALVAELLVTDADVADAVAVLRGQPSTLATIDWTEVLYIAQLIFKLIRQRMGESS